MRLDKYMAEYWPEYSRSTWQQYIEMGLVQVNEVCITSVRHELGEDDAVTVMTIPVADFKGQSLPVIYEDDHVTVIDKPSGVLTHAKGSVNSEFNVAEFMRPRMKEADDSNRPGIVHRLDRATSGVIICARDMATKKLLQKQFQDRKAYKKYYAIVDNVPKEPAAMIDLPIERNPKSPSTFRVGSQGKPAQTSYQVISSNDKCSLVELKPLTGRTHQLRVHLSYIGNPIVGDFLYGGSTSPIGRLCLHASSLEITIPTSDRRTFEAPLPKDFLKFAREVGYEA